MDFTLDYSVYLWGGERERKKELLKEANMTHKANDTKLDVYPIMCVREIHLTPIVVVKLHSHDIDDQRKESIVVIKM